MNPKNLRFACGRLIVGLVFVFGLFSLGSAQEKSWRCPTPEGPVLDRTACDPNIDLTSNSISRLLMLVLSDAAVPGGVTLLYGDDGDVTYRLNAASRSLKDILVSIQLADSRYRWNEERGVINLAPMDDYPFLNVRIKKFAEKDQTMVGLLGKFTESSEFQKALAANGISLPHKSHYGGLSSTAPPRRFSIELENVTVREVLNEIVRLNGRSTWAYQEYPGQEDGMAKRFYRLRFLVNHF